MMLLPALAANEPTRSQILSDFVRAQPALRSRLILPITIVVLQLVAMAMVRMADGPEAFIEGIVARGGSAILLFGALPIAMRLASRASGPLDAGSMDLASLRGFSVSEVTASERALVPRWVGKRVALLLSPLLIASIVFSLPSLSLTLERAIKGGVLLLIVSGVASLLSGLGLQLGARQKHGRRILIGLLVLPMLLVLVTNLPREFSLPGLYAAMIDNVLNAGH